MKTAVAEELKYRVALSLVRGVGSVTGKTLVSYCGSAEAVFREKKYKLEKIPDIGPVTADAIINHSIFERAEEEISFIEKYKITPLFYTEKNYPSRLKNCNDSPLLLYYKGNADLNCPRIIAMVGTRSASSYGKSVCSEIITALSDKNILVVSGLAYGIDIAAHKATLKNEMKTVGVLGHGLDKIYPSMHRSVAERMLNSGGLLTEFTSKTKPDRENFLLRNRIIAGMSDAVIVIEAAVTGGALITAKIAASYNRDVFAVPGRTTDGFSQGCHQLIKSNIAALVESADDIMLMLGWKDADVDRKKRSVQKELFVELKPEERTLIDLFKDKSQLNIDFICNQSAMPASKVAATLLNLEFSGLIKSLPGKVYELV